MVNRSCKCKFLVFVNWEPLVFLLLIISLIFSDFPSDLFYLMFPVPLLPHENEVHSATLCALDGLILSALSNTVNLRPVSRPFSFQIRCIFDSYVLQLSYYET